MKHVLSSGICAFALMVGSLQANADVVLTSNNFDGVANDIGPAFQQFGNGNGGGSANPATGSINSGVATNGSWGLNNVGLVDVNAVTDSTGFTAEWVVDSASVDNVLSNGWFFGVVSGRDATGTGQASLFNNNPASIGIRLLGGSNPDLDLVQDPQGGANAGIQLTDLGGTPTTDSIEDGFTLSLTINDDNTYTASSIGLSNDFSTSGTLTTSNGTTPLYATIAGGVGVNTSIQGANNTYTLSSASLTAITPTAVPEPSAGVVALFGLTGLVLRRRRA